jgi:hypothetical protein
MWQRRFVSAAALAVVLIIATLLPELFARSPEGRTWAEAWYGRFVSKVGPLSAPDAEGAWHSWNFLNQSLSGTLYRLGTRVTKPTPIQWNVCLIALDGEQLRWVTAAAKVSVMLLLAYVTWPVGSADGSKSSPLPYAVLNHGAAILCAMVLLSPMSSKQHFCVLFTPICVLITEWLYHRRGMVVSSVLASVFVLGTLGGKDLVGRALHEQLGAYGSLTWCALACLMGCCAVASRLRRENAVREVASALHATQLTLRTTSRVHPATVSV